MSATKRGETTPLLINSKAKQSMVTEKELHSSFLRISFLFAINHGALLSCLGLASARLGNVVASTSSSVLYVFNTGFALLGAPYLVKLSGPHNGLIIGMLMCAAYVASFWAVVAVCNNATGGGDGAQEESLQQANACSETISIIGSVIGGIGSAVLWTSQGSYFSSLCAQYSRSIEELNIPFEKVTSKLGGEWAFMFLFIEFWMRILSTILANGIHTSVASEDAWFNHGMNWRGIFGVYSILAFGAAIMMNWVTYHGEDSSREMEESTAIPSEEDSNMNNEDPMFENADQNDANMNTILEIESIPISPKSPLRQAAAAVDLLIHDNKMKYLSFINTTFGLCTAFVTLVVNGQVIRIALHDYSSRYVGIFTATSSMVAAILSWAFGALDWLSHSVVDGQDLSIRGKLIRCITFFQPNKGRILTIGALSYLLIAFLFLLFPSYDSWNFGSLLLIYVLLGIGRSTYEGTLRAVFADFFPQEREGAFANIILGTGLASVLGFWLAGVSPFALEVVTITSAILAIVGFWKANALYISEQERLEPLPSSEDFVIT